MSQLALPLHWEPLFADALFFVSDSNAEAFRWIKQWPAWPHRCLCVWGPRHSGKTHLATIWAREARASWISQSTIPEVEPGGAYIFDAFCAEHCAERAMFSFYNSLKEKRASCLFLSELPLARLPCELLDLRSRLATVPSVPIHLPDDALLIKIGEKCFADRGMRVPYRVLHFLVQRVARSFLGMQDAVTRIHQRVLEMRKAQPTVAIIKDVLNEMADVPEPYLSS